MNESQEPRYSQSAVERGPTEHIPNPTATLEENRTAGETELAVGNSVSHIGKKLVPIHPVKHPSSFVPLSDDLIGSLPTLRSRPDRFPGLGASSVQPSV